MSRISKHEYFMQLAEVAATRSEDPFHRVGTIAVNSESRVVATAYNGLLPGQIETTGWWSSKQKKRPFVIHAEENLCSLFRRGEVERVYVTLQPCPSCFKLLAAHGVQHVHYRERHAKSSDSSILAMFYNIELSCLHPLAAVGLYDPLTTPEKPND